MKKAVLDKDSVLIGFEDVEGLKEGDIDGGDGDLNTNRQYKWIGTEFMALGYGYPRPSPLQNGVDREQALYLLMKALTEDKPIPQECKDWVNWYRLNLKKRNEEYLKKGRKI